MAIIIPFADLVRRRRQQRHQALTQVCVDLFELNLAFVKELHDHGPAPERPLRARQIQLLRELLDYTKTSAED